VLRSFDQFANLVLERCIERIIVGEQFGDVELGVQLVRGENVVLLGEMDESLPELPARFKRVGEAEIKRALQAEKQSKEVLNSIKRNLNDFMDLE
jgi:U6 snRNA-associated Sm-like protein LSm1